MLMYLLLLLRPQCQSDRELPARRRDGGRSLRMTENLISIVAFAVAWKLAQKQTAAAAGLSVADDPGV